MQRFDENTLQGLYIQNLLYNYYLPNIRVLEVYRDDPEDVNISGYTFMPDDKERYIYKTTVRRHDNTKNPSENFNPEKDEIIHTFEPGKKYDNETSNFLSSSNTYTSEVHERLGDYLRFQRDFYNINLMSMYNCFSNVFIDQFSLPININKTNSSNTIKFIGSARNQLFKIFSFPVKFGKKYKLYCESPSAENNLQLGFYSNNKLININKDILIETSIDKKGEEVINDWTDNLSIKNPRLSFTTAYIFEVPNADKKLRPFEKYLRAFVQVPVSVNSSIVAIEVDPHIHDFCLNPSLTLKNYYSQHAFADRLFEFLIGNVITPNDSIMQNIVRIQKLMSSNKFEQLYGRKLDNYVLGQFDVQMHKCIYNTFRDLKVIYENNSEPRLVQDFTGYVDKDVEELIMRAQESAQSLYDRSSK